MWLFVAVGCAQADLEHQAIRCAASRECPADHPRCVGASMPDRPALANCSSTCSADTDCAAGYHCDPVGRFSCRTCIESCATTGCADDEVCEADGRCVLTQCTDAGAPPCPAGWHCEPSAPSSENEGAQPGPADLRHVARGCTRTRCDEPDGIECTDLWRCDPTRSDFATGCVPLPCSETGRCSNDVTFVCEPNNDGPRTPGTDPQGCVYKNCGEGVPCTTSQICDHGACRQRTCDELSCAAGSHCEHLTSDYDACVADPPSTAGAGGSFGSGGASGTGGSMTGEAATGGSSGKGGGVLAQVGHCE
jgi:hypothetical protein